MPDLRGTVLSELRENVSLVGHEMYSLIEELYPICRSITGNGVRRTLDLLRKTAPIEVHEVPSGTSAFDWTVPREWNIRDAYVQASDGRRVIDFQRSNLHVVGYSTPVRARMSLAELRPHLFALPGSPDAIPYRTSYYKETWGFCLSQRELDTLPDDQYDVVIDASLEQGSLTYGECFLPGATEDEVLFSCHVCHPSLCNDNLSGIALAATLAKHLSAVPHRYGYRFLFIPGTIGSITWLARNEAHVGRIKHGLVLACLGDPGGFTYKRSRRGNADVDAAASHVLRHSGRAARVVDFSPYGYDERQFCSPGFDLPVGCLMRTPHGEFPEYHTSHDDLDLVKADALADSFRACVEIVEILEHNTRYVNENPKCEPQLGKRGLYRAAGAAADGASRELAMLWILNMSDGSHTLLDIAERAGLRFDQVKAAADALIEHGLLRAVAGGGAA
jgi:aminopeptidase-like protein